MIKRIVNFRRAGTTFLKKTCRVETKLMWVSSIVLTSLLDCPSQMRCWCSKQLTVTVTSSLECPLSLNWIQQQSDQCLFTSLRQLCGHRFVSIAKLETYREKSERVACNDIGVFEPDF
jgi:hypothetical protein